jgi:hypothetical protein
MNILRLSRTLAISVTSCGVRVTQCRLYRSVTHPCLTRQVLTLLHEPETAGVAQDVKTEGIHL